MSPSIRHLGTEQRLSALINSRTLYEIGTAIEPEPAPVGRPTTNPAYAVLFLAVLGRLSRSTVRAETDLAHANTWTTVRHRMIKAIHHHGLDIPNPGRTPPAWHHWRRLRDKHLTTDHGLAALSRAFTTSAVTLAHDIGLLDPKGPGSFTHPDRSRVLYGDGTTVRPIYRPPTAIRTTDDHGQPITLYPDLSTGELLDTPPRRFDPDTAEYHGHAGPVHGHSYVTFQARGPQPYARVILAARHVPAPGQEANTALAVLKDLHRHVGNGAQVVVYDGAFRGIHIDQIMRECGWITIAPTQKHRTPIDPEAPAAIRLPNGTLARGYLLTPVTHTTPTGTCTHTLATINGRAVEIDLNIDGDPVVIRETTRGPIKRSPRKSGNYHFNAGITIHCPDKPFTTWLSPHATADTPKQPERLRLIPEGDDDWTRIRGIRSDAEGTWSQLKRTLIADRAASLGWRRGLTDLYTFAILNNAYTEATHRRAQAPRVKRHLCRVPQEPLA